MAINTFTFDIDKFSQETVEKSTLITKKTAIELFNSVVGDTPVDEGDLLGGWQITFNQPATADNDRQDKNGTIVKKEINSVVGRLNKDGEVFMTNLKPYAEVAEDGLWGTKNTDNPDSKVTTEGYSKRSPAGMVKKNIPRFDDLVKEASNEVGYK